MTGGRVIPLRAGIAPAPTKGEIDPILVEKLAELLDKARAGEVTGIAFALLHPGDLSTYNYSGRTTRGLLGALILLQHDMCSANAENT